MQLRYRYRAYPTTDQRTHLAKAFGCARVVFNDGIAARDAARRAGQPYLKNAALQRQVITEAKKMPERAWLVGVSSVVLVQAIQDLHAAYRSYFDSIEGRRKGPRVGPPKYRTRRGAQSIRLTRNGFVLRGNGRLYLAKIGDLEIRWSRPLPSPPSSVTVIRDTSGRFFVSFVVDLNTSGPIPDVLDETGNPIEIGIDLGVSAFAVDSNRRVVENPRHFKRIERRLKKAQRAAARRVGPYDVVAKVVRSPSRRWQRAKHRVAKLHARAADSRRDFLHKASTTLVRDNQTIAVETLKPRNLTRRAYGKGRAAKAALNRSILDAGWATFLSMLEYKAAMYGRIVVRISPWEPTSQLCSVCGHRDGKKPLKVRAWTCPECGVCHDRDINAARNILAAGRAERLNARGGPARPGAAMVVRGTVH